MRSSIATRILIYLLVAVGIGYFSYKQEFLLQGSGILAGLLMCCSAFFILGGRIGGKILLIAGILIPVLSFSYEALHAASDPGSGFFSFIVAIPTGGLLVIASLVMGSRFNTSSTEELSKIILFFLGLLSAVLILLPLFSKLL